MKSGDYPRLPRGNQKGLIMNQTTMTDGVAIQEGLAGLFIGVVNVFFNLLVVLFGNALTQLFTAFFSGLSSLFQTSM